MQNLQLISGHSVIELDTVDSTNNYAANLAKSGQIGNGTVILSAHQSHGRGQRGHIWQSDAGTNLLMSYVLTRPIFTHETQFYLNKAVALGVRDMVEKASAKCCKIKWPNDIFCDGLKLGGILIENSWRAQTLSSCIIGIGLNVNQTEFDTLRATSLAEILGKEQDVKSCLRSILESLDVRLEQVARKQWRQIADAFGECLYLKDQITD
ncbi:MAG: biotin--[acetyl-CoA-carboxylase] ligase, partial [Flavobacteriales bacterium]|nr:biotin--[acetyl-CoA-carboxylase] ligase [Flavobacteriales bacterium]